MASSAAWKTGRAGRQDTEGDRTSKRLLFISFIDFGDMSSGSSVRPQRMYKAFTGLGYETVLLSGLQNRRLERWKRVFKTYRALRKNPPGFCYVEPPSGPFFNLCDHLLLLWLKRKKVPIGLFYRDAYWKFADWWPVHGIKKFVLTKMQQFDLLIIKRTCKIVFFPTKSMAELFDLPRRELLPPAGVDLVTPSHPVGKRVLYIGGVSAFYGTDRMLRAFEIINEREKRDIRLTIVCRESEMGSFFDAYQGKPWLTVAHASGDEGLKPFYEDCDLALYPSRRDFYMDFCMPVKLFEYLSRGIPVVSTDCREAAAFVKGQGIGVVSRDDPESFAAAVIGLYDHPERIAQLRKRCIESLRGENLWEHRALKAAKEILG